MGAKSAGSSARVQRAAAGGKKSLKEKRRQVWVVNTIREQIDLAVDGKKSIVPTGKAYTKDSMPWNARLLLAFGTAWNADVHWHDSDGSRGAVRGDDQPCGWPALELFSKANDEEISREMGRHVLRVFSDRLAGVGAAPDANDYYADAKRMCELLGVDFHELRLQAEDAIPTPKAWVAEMAATKKGKAAAGKKRGKKGRAA